TAMSTSGVVIASSRTAATKQSRGRTFGARALDCFASTFAPRASSGLRGSLHLDPLHLLRIKTKMSFDARALGQRIHVAPHRIRGFALADAQRPIGRAALVRAV